MIDAVIGLRNLGRNRRRTLLTGSLVAFGVVCLIVFQSLKVGMHEQMIVSTTSLDNGILQIHAPDYRPNRSLLQPINDSVDLLDRLEQHQIRYAERLKTAALLLAGAQSSMISLSGIIPDHEAQVTQISNQMREGTYLGRSNTIVLSQALCQALSLSLNDQVTVMAQDSAGQPALAKLTIVGMFSTGLPSFDTTHGYVELATLQQLIKAPQVISEISIHTQLDNQNDMETRLLPLLSKDQRITRWQEALPDLVQLIELNDTTMSILIVIVFVLVGMGILNTMTMITYERFEEFGLLAALGYPPAGVIRMVLSEALFLGTGAALIGGLIGAVICLWLGQHGLDLSQLTSNNQYFTNAHILYPQLRWLDMVAAFLLAAVTCFFSGLFPAWKASRLNPVEALRHI